MSERQASTFRRGQFTSAHVQALNILGLNHVHYLAEEPVPIFGEFDSKGRPIVFKVDILINDANFGSGIIEIDGMVHHRGIHPAKDDKRDIMLGHQGLWVEHIDNQLVASVMAVLEKHRRPRDDYF